MSRPAAIKRGRRVPLPSAARSRASAEPCTHSSPAASRPPAAVSATFAASSGVTRCPVSRRSASGTRHGIGRHAAEHDARAPADVAYPSRARPPRSPPRASRLRDPSPCDTCCACRGEPRAVRWTRAPHRRPRTFSRAAFCRGSTKKSAAATVRSPLGPSDVELRVERHQSRRGIGRMHDETRAAAEDGVELVLAVDREAGVAAGFEAREAVAEIPAPRALAHVARERPGIADLRRRHAPGRFGQHGVFAADERMVAERVERDQAADLHAAGCQPST